VTDLPNYDDLPAAPDGGRSGWGLFGSQDNVGLFNLLTPERVVAAARLVRKGAVFPLDAPIDAFNPPLAASRGMPRHHLVHEPGGVVFDDLYDNFFPQGSSQWDSLGHVGHAPDRFYNGATEDDVASGRRNTIEHWARRGVVGRAVLLDLVRAMADNGRQRAGVAFEPGDIVILHTGFAAWYVGLSPKERAAAVKGGAAIGVAQGEPMCRYLWDSHISALASDTFAVEALPPTSIDATGFLHGMLIGQFGMALGELWWTEDLAGDCAADGVSEFLLVSSPMNAPGAVGSPPNACAIK